MLEDEGRPPNAAPARPAWSGYRPFLVDSVHRESDTVRSFVLVAADGSALPAALPGQFLALRIDRGPAGSPILRSYSISGGVPGRSYRISVKRADGEGSRFLHEQVDTGRHVEVSAPRGDFTLVADGAPVVLVSAGIGITPLLPMLQALAAESTARMVWWIHSARSGGEDVFREEARAALARLPGSREMLFYSRPGVTDVEGRDYEVGGRIDGPRLAAMHLPPDAHYYLCGPQAFMRQMMAELRALGTDDAHIHSETFGVEASITPGTTGPGSRAPHPPGEAGTGPTVTFNRSGVSAAWDSRYGSLLELAEACDIPVRWSCRTGVCHTCQSGLVEGSVAYAPDPLTLPPEGDVLICCATPCGPLSLDL
jgi:ferredoxin-NADP reductase